MKKFFTPTMIGICIFGAVFLLAALMTIIKYLWIIIPIFIGFILCKMVGNMVMDVWKERKNNKKRKGE